jgi:hypothetical protein
MLCSRSGSTRQGKRPDQVAVQPDPPKKDTHGSEEEAKGKIITADGSSSIGTFDCSGRPNEWSSAGCSGGGATVPSTASPRSTRRGLPFFFRSLCCVSGQRFIWLLCAHQDGMIFGKVIAKSFQPIEPEQVLDCQHWSPSPLPHRQTSSSPAACNRETPACFDPMR